VVLLGDHEHVRGRLRIDVTESESSITLHYSRRWCLPRHNLAEKAVSHRRDLNVRPQPGYCFP
jgi:hypothetical protein